MSYKITIEKIETVSTMQRGAWTVIDKRPWTDDEMEGYNYPTGTTPTLKEIHGYAPDRMGSETRITEIYSQTVDHDLDIGGVISAINGL